MGSIKIDPYALGFAPRLLAAAVSLSFVGGGGGGGDYLPHCSSSSLQKCGAGRGLRH